MTLFDFLKKEFNIETCVLNEILDHATTKTYMKGEIVADVHSNNTPASNKVYFVESGIARTFYYKDIKDISHYFFTENTFKLNVDILTNKKESPYGFQALDACVITEFPYDVIQRLSDSHISINKLIQKLMLDVIFNFSSRLYDMQFENANERYHNFIQSHPEIHAKASLGHIASYLGISQQTLSVIRANK